MAIKSCFKSTVFLAVLCLIGCGNSTKTRGTANASPTTHDTVPQAPIVVGANQTEAYLPLLKGKKLAVVANQTSVIFKEDNASEGPAFTHLVDSLLALGQEVTRVFAPEHGFRGEADAGEHVQDGIDKATGLPVISLYGKNRKPGPEHLEGVDLVLFDIQDLGVRFYTYIATLQLVMEACADLGIPVLVLDRPNPNGHYVDGPVMEKEHTGFLGLTPIPLVYGMTIGEYAQMINKEGWLDAKTAAQLTVIPLQHYTHQSRYSLPIRPSPNIPNDQAVNLYPSLGLFEGTKVNAGRGTEYQFQRYGAPFLDSLHFSFSYTPRPNFGAKSPKHEGELCYGEDLSQYPFMSEVSLQWLMKAYTHADDKQAFFNTDGFTRHAGTARLQQQIEAGQTEAAIKASWKEGLEAFEAIRARYLMYP